MGILAIGLTFLVSCAKESSPNIPSLGLMEVPKGFPNIDHPQDNAFTQERWELGRQLFYDTRLSKSGKTSCNSCHRQELAFADDVALSLGDQDRVGRRNAPSLANVAFHPYFTREGGVPTLEMQVLVPIQEHDEFDHNIVDIAEELKLDKDLNDKAQTAYGREMSPFVITRALAQFERSLISGQSDFDLEINYGIQGTLSQEAMEGYRLFNSEKTNCSQCHSGFNFTNYAFENNGLYEEYADNGRERLTQDPNDKALFKVPSLRTVALTAPYMHDGSLTSLDDVLDHYNEGGYDHPHKNEHIRPLHLSNSELFALKQFLMALTDQRFINNELYHE